MLSAPPPPLNLTDSGSNGGASSIRSSSSSVAAAAAARGGVPQQLRSPTTMGTQSQSPVSPNGLHSAAPLRPPMPVHKRTYQACIPCRQRKVRCDLGSVEAPHDPPCVRCRRESKDCFFSATRRKKTPTDEIPPGLGRGRLLQRKRDDDLEPLSYKRARTLSIGDNDSDGTDVPFRSPMRRQFDQRIDPALQESNSAGIGPKRSTSPRLGPSLPPHLRQQQEQQGNTSADTILQSEVYNSHEALLTLIEAAGKDTPMNHPLKSESQDSEDDDQEDSVVSGHVRTASSSGTRHVHSPASLRMGQSRWDRNVRFSASVSEGTPTTAGKSASTTGSHPMKPSHQRNSSGSVVSPGSVQRATGMLDADDEGLKRALRSWNKFRFVKAGWFTAREAVDFMQHFYDHLHPLSPTLTNPTLLHASHPKYHHLLLRHEPFLATVIITVASRYMPLPGPGGISRSFAIHDMLWREVRNAFERIMWGGGWGGLGILKPMGESPNMPVDPPNGATTGRGLRTLGTVEALMILTEWHVRGIHFPMDVEESDWGIEISDDEEEKAKNKKAHMGGLVVEGLGDRLENILEPAYRSDRMSWMLLGNSLALAYELGVFDEIEGTATPAPTPPASTGLANGPVDARITFRLRCRRIQRLLLVYIMQLASRLGWTSMIPKGVRESVQAQLTSPTVPLGRRDWSNPDELQDAVFSIWVELTTFMTATADQLFPSRSGTREIMRSGRYVALLDHFQPELQKWKDRFEALNLPPAMYHILVLEYEHVRFYINSLALQAVVDRCSLASFNAASPTASRNAAAAAAAPLAALWEMTPRDVEFIREVVDASRSLLSTVVQHMAPLGYLRHAPVRVHFRILSAAMFLLKTFVLGAKEVEVKESMTLVEEVCRCLKDASVDDLHLGLRFADMLEGLAKRVRSRFVKVARAGGSRAGSPIPEDGHQQQQQQQHFQPHQQQENLDHQQHLQAYPNNLPTPSDLYPHHSPSLHSHPDHHQPSGFTPLPHYSDHNGGDSVMTNGGYDGGDGNGTGGWGGAWPGSDDWLALPLDPILGFEGVTQGTMGVDVGGMDLLEVLLGGGGNNGA